MQLRRATSSDLESMAALAAPLQQRPDRHIAYLGSDEPGILAELSEITWQQSSAIAFDGDRMLGWLVGDVDDEMGRVWWNGPFVSSGDWAHVADALLAECRSQLAADVDEEEFAIDVAFVACERWTTGIGFVSDVGSYVLQLVGDVAGPEVATRAVTSDDLEAVAALHEMLFPNTHTTGHALVERRDETHVRLVVEREGRIVGYVAVERQPDGSGYIDYLGVAPEYRRRGLGRELVRAGVVALRSLAVDSVNLTVRETSDGARELYASLGFVEERLVRPFRLGFAQP